MNCHYPLCREAALYTPVLELPTIRTVGRDVPVLTHIERDERAMSAYGLSQRMAILLYERALDDYKRHSTDIAKTDQPTYLLGKEVCLAHRNTYNLADWFNARDWAVMQEAARHNGFAIPAITVMVVQFRPLYWQPRSTHLELARV